jgi:hypothetical protein
LRHIHICLIQGSSSVCILTHADAILTWATAFSMTLALLRFSPKYHFLTGRTGFFCSVWPTGMMKAYWGGHVNPSCLPQVSTWN